MRLLVTNHLANAFEALRSNRLRTTLTVAGVTIGVASIIIILSLSAGAARIITDQVDQLGGTIAVVRPGKPEHDTQLNNLTATLSGSQTTSSLNESDLKEIAKLDDVAAVAPLMLLGGSVSTDSSKPRNVEIIATTPELTKVASLPLDEGQFIDTVTNENTAVIGSQLAIDLYGTQEAAGRTFRTHGVRFTVIGILKRQNDPINYNNVDFDHTAIISLASGKKFNQGVAAIQQINIKAVNADRLQTVVKQADARLSTNHNSEKDYVILSGDTLARPSNELFSTVAVTLTTVAAVSLIVGGIGIMNIMLVGVTERTREIGIRKALGASNTHITWQFLIESLAMSLAGGVLGYIAGYICAFSIARTLLTFDPAFDWPIVWTAFTISFVVGLIFGLYPALRASRKDPIEALRDYH
jgi:putative ABC transport system permease protein